MTTPIPAVAFTDPAPAECLERTAAALTAHGFAVEVVDDAAAARERVKDLIPQGASVLTGASETLRLSGIDADVNTSGRYQAIKPQTWPWTASPPPTTSAATRRPRRCRGQRPRGHRNRLSRGRLGHREPAA